MQSVPQMGGVTPGPHYASTWGPAIGLLIPLLWTVVFWASNGGVRQIYRFDVPLLWSHLIF